MRMYFESNTKADIDGINTAIYNGLGIDPSSGTLKYCDTYKRTNSNVWYTDINPARAIYLSAQQLALEVESVDTTLYSYAMYE